MNPTAICLPFAAAPMGAAPIPGGPNGGSTCPGGGSCGGSGGGGCNGRMGPMPSPKMPWILPFAGLMPALGEGMMPMATPTCPNVVDEPELPA